MTAKPYAGPCGSGPEKVVVLFDEVGYKTLSVEAAVERDLLIRE